MPLPRLLEDGRLPRPEPLDELVALPDIRLDLGSVIVIVGQGGMDLGQGDRGQILDDLGRAHPHPYVHDGDILDLDAVAEDVRLAAAIAGLDADILADHGDYPLRLG